MRRVAAVATLLLTGTAFCALVAHAAEEPRSYELRAIQGCKVRRATGQTGVFEIRCRAGRQRIEVVAYGSPEGLCAPQPSTSVRCDHGEPFGMQLNSGQRICMCVSGAGERSRTLVVGVPGASAVVRGTVEEPGDAVRVLQLSEMATEFLTGQH